MAPYLYTRFLLPRNERKGEHPREKHLAKDVSGNAGFVVSTSPKEDNNSVCGPNPNQTIHIAGVINTLEAVQLIG